MRTANLPTAITKTTAVTCPCGQTTARGARHQRFCSTKCRKRYWGKTRCRKAGMGGDTREATHRPNKINGINGSRALNRGPIPPVFEPADIIEVEVFGGTWERAVSDDGVVTFVRCQAVVMKAAVMVMAISAVMSASIMAEISTAAAP